MEKLELEKFNPTVADIQKIVEEGKGITISDFTNKAQLKLVKDQRVKLRDIRTNIARQGKEFRQQAIDFQRAVIGKEKELIALVEPEELRLAALEEQAEKAKERSDRLLLLPNRKDKLAAVGDGIKVSDEDILGMDSVAFDEYCNKRVTDKNDADRLVLEVRQREVREAEEKLAREMEMRDREDRARQEERERTTYARIEDEQRVKADVERKDQEAKEAVLKLASDKEYQDFLASHGWTNETAGEFYVEVRDNTYFLYKKIGEITL